MKEYHQSPTMFPRISEWDGGGLGNRTAMRREAYMYSVYCIGAESLQADTLRRSSSLA